jgi:hypothetical protein
VLFLCLMGRLEKKREEHKETRKKRCTMAPISGESASHDGQKKKKPARVSWRRVRVDGEEQGDGEEKDGRRRHSVYSVDHCTSTCNRTSSHRSACVRVCVCVCLCVSLRRCVAFSFQKSSYPLSFPPLSHVRLAMRRSEVERRMHRHKVLHTRQYVKSRSEGNQHNNEKKKNKTSTRGEFCLCSAFVCCFCYFVFS